MTASPLSMADSTGNHVRRSFISSHLIRFLTLSFSGKFCRHFTSSTYNMSKIILTSWKVFRWHIKRIYFFDELVSNGCSSSRIRCIFKKNCSRNESASKFLIFSSVIRQVFIIISFFWKLCSDFVMKTLN